MFVRPISKEKSWVWWHIPVTPATVGCLKRMIIFQLSLCKKQNPISKITRAKTAGGTAQA
jgi:hypothetical protein